MQGSGGLTPRHRGPAQPLQAGPRPGTGQLEGLQCRGRRKGPCRGETLRASSGRWRGRSRGAGGALCPGGIQLAPTVALSPSTRMDGHLRWHCSPSGRGPAFPCCFLHSAGGKPWRMHEHRSVSHRQGIRILPRCSEGYSQALLRSVPHISLGQELPTVP